MHLAADNQATLVITVLIVLLIVVTMINGALFLAWALRKDRVDAGLAPPIFSPRWSLVHVWIAGQVIVIALIPCVLALMAGMVLIGKVTLNDLFQGAGTSKLSRSYLWIGLLSMFPQFTLMAGIPLLVITKRYRIPLSQIGLTRFPSARDWKWGLLGGIGLMCLGWIMENSLGWVLSHFLSAAQVKSLADLTKSLGNEGFISSIREPAMFAVLLVGGGFFGPLAEEVFFRGVLHNSARRRLGIVGGTLLSAMIFAVVHGGPILVLGIIPMGILLAIMYERTGSLWVPILMHIFNNTLQLVSFYLSRPGA